MKNIQFTNIGISAFRLASYSSFFQVGMDSRFWDGYIPITNGSTRQRSASYFPKSRYPII